MRRVWGRASRVGAALAVLAGGCQCQVRYVEVGYRACDPAGTIAVGDSFDVWAVAYAARGDVLGISGLFDSETQPGRFRWSVEPESLAEIRPRNRVHARARGEITIRATAEGVAGFTIAALVHSAGTVQHSIPRNVRLGDTVHGDFVRHDGEGIPVAPTSAATVLPDLRGHIRPLVEATPGRAAFVAIATGLTPVTWCFEGRTGMSPVAIQP